MTDGREPADRLSWVPIRMERQGVPATGYPQKRLGTAVRSSGPAAKRLDASRDLTTEADRSKAAKAGPRSAAMRLAAEVERLAAELERSRARIVDLEAKIDIDPLTELLNRRGFERELRRSVAYVKRYGSSAALIYLDLDGFKRVNDRHGHAAGDAVLRAVKAALVRHVRASDVVGRIGGDEFVVLLWNVGGATASAKAAALEQAIQSSSVAWGGSTLAVGASAGVVLIGVLDSPDESLARADAAMYARKTARKT
jgi:diguanylate cyclase (GGDEF)-like protein